jgi:DNA polymerase I
MIAAARMERNGVPIDTALLALMDQHWGSLQDQLIADIDQTYGVFEGQTFKADRFAARLLRAGIPWPRFGDRKVGFER